MDQEVQEQPSALQLREQGNSFYKDGLLAKAIEKYRAASEIDPQDPLPWQNLSSAYFEAGSHTNCIIAAKRSLSLLGAKDEERRRRVKIRLLTSFLHTHQWELASQLVRELGGPESDGMRVYQATIDQAKRVWTAFSDEKIAREKVVMDLPRYKASVCNVLEPHVYGHDDIRSQFDEDVATNDPDGDFSVFFAGIGDARHLYATLLSIARFEKARPSDSPKKEYYFTINDIKALPFARNLVMIHLLEELSEVRDHASSEAIDLLNSIFFIFVGAVIPPYVYSRLQQSIKAVTDSLETGQGLPEYIFIHSTDRQRIIDVLVSWQGRAQKFYSTSDAIRVTASNAERDAKFASSIFGTFDPPEGCQDELMLFYGTAFLQPAASLFRTQDAPLKEILQRYRCRVTDAFPDIKRYLGSHWRVNVTSIDTQWESQGPVPSSSNFTSDPISLGYKLYKDTNLRAPRGCACAYDYVAPFFSHLARALRVLKGKITLEISLGDFAVELERRRYGLVPEGSHAASPKLYNRIHLSNVPDYVGGHLSTFVYSTLMCKTQPGSYITSTCLRSPTSWPTVDHFVNEYLAINDRGTLRKLLQVQQIRGHFDGNCPNLQIMPLWSYVHWQRSKSKPHTFSALLSRPALTRWVYMIFFKLAIPFYRYTVAVESPLNMTIFLRLLSHLHEMGYPKQWLSTILVDILENNVTTTIRPPETSPLKLEEPDTEHAAAKLSTAPYAVEMSTLTSVHQRVLPFAVITQTLPPPQDVYEYTLQLPFVDDGDVLRPVIVLVFLSRYLIDLAKRDERISIRPLLAFESSTAPSDLAPEMSKAVNEGITIQSTITIQRREKVVRFWMKEGVIEKMVAGRDWKYALWRTDDWGPTSKQFFLDEEKFTQGKRWTQTEVPDEASDGEGNRG